MLCRGAGNQEGPGLRLCDGGPLLHARVLSRNGECGECVRVRRFQLRGGHDSKAPQVRQARRRPIHRAGFSGRRSEEGGKDGRRFRRRWGRRRGPCLWGPRVLPGGARERSARRSGLGRSGCRPHPRGVDALVAPGALDLRATRPGILVLRGFRKLHRLQLEADGPIPRLRRHRPLPVPKGQVRGGGDGLRGVLWGPGVQRLDRVGR